MTEIALPEPDPATSIGVARGGWRHPNAKLFAAEVRAIRRGLATGATPTELAREYNVSRKVIYQIKNGVTYGWVKEDSP